MRKYELSVVVPLHNTEPELFAASVNSWKKQTIGFSNVEWVVVMHNCEPGIIAFVRDLIGGHENVVLKELNNDVHSPSSPRNWGIENATGTYITFLDADDRYTPECLAMALRYIKETDADVCHFRKIIQMAEPVGVMLNEMVLWDQTQETIVVTPEHWDMERLFVGTWEQCTSKLYRRSLLIDHQVRFDETLTMCEDALFVLTVYGLIRRLCLAPQLVGYIYFMHAGSLSQTTVMSEERVLGYVRGVKKVFDRGLENGFWMNDSIASILLLVILWIKSCPQMSPEGMQEIRTTLNPYVQALEPIKPSKIHENGRSDRLNTLIKKVLLGQDSDFGTFIDRAGDPMVNSLLDRQRDALARVIGNGQETDYGRRFGFRDLLTLEDYARMVPPGDHERYQPMVRLTVELGERDIFTHREITAYAMAYGSLANPIRIPFTARGLEPYTYAFRKCIGPGETFLMMESSPFRKTVLSMDTKHTDVLSGLILTEYFSDCVRYAQRSVNFTEPSERLITRANMDSELIKLLFALRSRDVETIFAMNGWDVYSSLDKLYRKWESICSDLETGSITSLSRDIPEDVLAAIQSAWKPNPKRAQELRALFGGDAEPTLTQIWPKLKRVVANCTGSHAFYAGSIRKRLGKAELNNGFLADEFAMYGLAHGDGQSFILDTDSAYYEFTPIYGNPFGPTLTVGQLKAGEDYDVLVSNMNGLYRYRTRMQLHCVSVSSGEVRVRPLCPVNYDLSAMYGLREEDVVAAVEDCEAALPFEIADFTFMREDRTFMLVLEPADSRGYRLATEADLEELSARVGGILGERVPAIRGIKVHIRFCEPESHLLFRERESFRSNIPGSSVRPCHVTDNPVICRFFRPEQVI